MQEVRDIIPGPIPEGDLPPGVVVLKPPEEEWAFKKHLAVAGAMARASKSWASECCHIMRYDDRGVAKKAERMVAVLITALVQETYNPRTLYQGGFRPAICQCSPGCGHCS